MYPFGRNYLPPPFYNHPALFNRALPYHSPQLLYGGLSPYFNPNSLIGYSVAPDNRGEWTFTDVPIGGYPTTSLPLDPFFGWNSGAMNPLLSNSYFPYNPLNFVNKISSLQDKVKHDDSDSYSKPSTKHYGDEKHYDQYRPYDRNSFLTAAAALHNGHVLGKAKDSDYKTED